MKIGRKIAKLQMPENVHKNVNENMYRTREKHYSNPVSCWILS